MKIQKKSWPNTPRWRLVATTTKSGQTLANYGASDIISLYRGQQRALWEFALPTSLANRNFQCSFRFWFTKNNMEEHYLYNMSENFTEGSFTGCGTTGNPSCSVCPNRGATWQHRSQCNNWAVAGGSLDKLQDTEPKMTKNTAGIMDASSACVAAARTGGNLRLAMFIGEVGADCEIAQRSHPSNPIPRLVAWTCSSADCDPGEVFDPSLCNAATWDRSGCKKLGYTSFTRTASQVTGEGGRYEVRFHMVVDYLNMEQIPRRALDLDGRGQ
eukprot:g42238.t1